MPIEPGQVDMLPDIEETTVAPSSDSSAVASFSETTSAPPLEREGSTRGDLYDTIQLKPSAALLAGAQKYREKGIFIGVDGGKYKLFFGDPAGDYVDFNGTTLDISGGVSVDTIDIGGSDTSSFHVDINGNMWLGAADFASAPFKVSAAGTGTAVSMTLTGSNVNGSGLTLEDIFGDGSDGDVTISGSTTLTRDMFYDDLTIQNGGVLNAASFRVFVSGVLTIDVGGDFNRNGNNGSAGGNGASNVGGAAGAGGTALADGSLKGAVAGSNGGLGGSSSTSRANGVAGTSVAKSIGVVGAAGGRGYDPGLSGFVGTAAAAGSKTGTVYNTPRTALSAYLLYDFLPSGDNLKSSTGSGGGGGGDRSGGAAAGGGGGGAGTSGGILCAFARTIVLNGTIRANGGNGGSGGSGFSTVGTSGGGGGGGGAGSGGVVLLVYTAKTGTGSVSVAAGTPGPAGLGSDGGSPNTNRDGEIGGSGNTGTVIEIVV